MSTVPFKKVAGGPRPLVKQTINTCGLASLAMVFLHHARPVDQFLEAVYSAKHANGAHPGARRGKNQGVSHDAAIIWSTGYLLAKARLSRRVSNWFGRHDGSFVYEDFKLNIDMLLDSIAQREARREKALGSALKHYKHGTIRKIFVTRYLEQFKTQLELKILAAMFGFEFLPYPGDTMGNLYFTNGDRAAGEKVAYIREVLDKPDHAAILGHGQSHWMVPHTLLKGGLDGQEYALGINDPLGSNNVLPLKRLDHTYLFYFFKFDEGRCREGIRFLGDVLHI
ncbi:MAG: hypothetical protein JW839_07970 [Candidatus Lokiarchaeota archaeon]|nr:hypothetical protein [Candidatus Lokiarchaeota archaeon]